MSFMEEFDHLKIQLKDIIEATDNFGPDKLIGRGGFGLVYKGELSLPDGRSMVAFKRLDSRFGQGNNEFWREIMMLSKCRHENLVTLLYFCIEGDERILVYEYASRGSLDRYLSDPSLTWTQRLEICIGVAHALNYLHDPMETHQRVLHRDIKSSNILLDEKWTPKVSDFGLSKVGPANLPQTFVVSHIVGTPGYCDPSYLEMGFLSKETDLYSFGVVLFEVMCGKLCCEYHDGKLTRILVPSWKKACDEKRLDDIICSNLKEQIDWNSLLTFSTIASRCLNEDHRERPTMAKIIKELEVALQQRFAGPPLSYKLQEELLSLLSRRTLVVGGKTCLSTNKNGEICEMISAIKCISGDKLEPRSVKNSRFSNVLRGAIYTDFKVEARTQFLLPHVTYTVNLVFRHSDMDHGTYVPFKYKLDEETHYSNSCIAHVREDGWLMTELYQFTSYLNEHDFRIEFLSPSSYLIRRPFLLEGIEFRPLEHEKQEILDDENKGDTQPISNSDTYWEQKLPTNYIDLIKLSKDSVQWTTKKELYFLLRKGFLIDNGEKWFSVSKNMKKYLMIRASAFLLKEEWIWKSLPESRFEVVAKSPNRGGFSVAFRFKSELLSPQTTYSCHLIYKPTEKHSLLEGLVVMFIKDSLHLSNCTRYIYLMTPPHTPIIGPNVDQKCHSPSNTHKIKGHPKLRKDGWMEFQLWEVSADATGTIWMQVKLSCYDVCENYNFAGLLVQGIEFRPL